MTPRQEELASRIDAFERLQGEATEAFKKMREYILKHNITKEEMAEVFVKHQKLPEKAGWLQALRVWKITHQKQLE